MNYFSLDFGIRTILAVFYETFIARSFIVFSRTQLTTLDQKEEYFVRVIARNKEGESFPVVSPVISLKSSACEYFTV